jgi:hypothetical protein
VDFGDLYSHPDPHQIKIRIRIKIYNPDPEPDPDPHQFADDKPKCMEYEQPIEHFFKGLSLYLESRIWIRIQICIRVKNLIRIRMK